MVYIDEQLRWVTTQDPVNAEDIHKMLLEGIGKMEKPPKEIIMCPEVYNILKKDYERFCVSRDYLPTYCGIKIKVEDLPQDQLFVIVSASPY